MANEKFHPDFDNDLADLQVKFAGQFDVFMDMLTKEIDNLHKYPTENTAQLKKPTLSYYGYRKVKFHSSNPREKSNMRL
ncbi:hypothetical protein, partial [Bacillus cereus]|uniref:hypothetical protein n=1 Tax=Bacillus cereus TaxID=1396 RepID=UPI000A43301C